MTTFQARGCQRLLGREFEEGGERRRMMRIRMTEREKE
jgi:hypothetical protein